MLRLALPPHRFIVLLMLSYVMHVLLLLNDNDGDEGLYVALSGRTDARFIEVSFLSC